MKEDEEKESNHQHDAFKSAGEEGIIRKNWRKIIGPIHHAAESSSRQLQSNSNLGGTASSSSMRRGRHWQSHFRLAKVPSMHLMAPFDCHHPYFLKIAQRSFMLMEQGRNFGSSKI